MKPFAAVLLFMLGCPRHAEGGAVLVAPDAAANDTQQSMRDVSRFRRLTTMSTMADVKRLAGEPDGDVGSGIYMYSWKLDDDTHVIVGTPDNDKILYVDWKKADGTTERLVGAL
jgi:hypothetical protein